MGHFASYCAITHYPITGGTRCVAISTKPRSIPEPHKDVATCTFLRGAYNDYGNIELDKQEFTNLAKFENERPTMFILESVFDQVRNTAVGDGNCRPTLFTAFEDSRVTKYLLTKVGFVEHLEKREDRYRFILTHPNEPGTKVYSDGTWVEVELPDGKLLRGINNFSALSKHLPNVDYSYLHGTSDILASVQETVHKLKEDDLFLSSDNPIIKKYATERVCESLGLHHTLFDILKVPEFHHAVVDIIAVSRFMYCNNLRFGEQYGGGVQDGNLPAYRRLVQLMQLAKKNKG